MSQSIYGGVLTWSGSAAQSVLGVANNYDGVGAYALLIRANNAGIQLGGPELDVPQAGFELVDDQEYTFHVKAVAGTNQDNTVYVRNPGGGSNSVSYLIVPE